MAPNLFLLYKKVVTPWTWYNPKKSKTRNARKLFVSNEPIPGLYAFTTQKKRYLVALKPKGRKDEEHIFKSDPSNEDSQVKSTAGFTGRNNASRPNSNEDGHIQPRSLDSTEEDNNSSEKTHLSNTDTYVTEYSSLSSISSTQPVKSAAFVMGDDTTEHITASPLNHKDQNQTSTSLSAQETISITSPDKDILKNDGVLLRQSPPFEQNNRNQSASSLTSLGSNIYKYDIHGIEKVHLDDYKFLRDPLRIEYCLATKRWMFASEIRQRTIISPMCRNLNCMEKDMILCGKTVDMKLFCLDDAESWVVIGKGNGGYVSKRWKHHLGQNGRLYSVDEETECIRRQTVEEVKASRVRLASSQARFAVFDDEASYMPIVRYLERAE